MDFLIEGITHLTWEHGVMFVVGALLIWLGIKKGYEPALLIPMGFGAIL
ncbi:MAG: sodium ion-translocating decarboxylase subunit beta, partial [Lachnospiraceae bacterium]|nr:sodium ion-translocating decarboxylase subunit beta [Lachnospiraceae bacterium]